MWEVLGSAEHITNDYCILDLYIPGKINSKISVAHIRQKVHIVDNLKAKMLMGTDILGPKEMCVLLIKGCRGLIANIKVKAKANVDICHAVHSQKKVIILPKSLTKIPVELRTKQCLPDIDHLFKPNLPGAYAHIVDAIIPFVYIENNGDTVRILPRHSNLGTIVEYNVDSCYAAHVENHMFAAEKNDIKVSKPESASDIN